MTKTPFLTKLIVFTALLYSLSIQTTAYSASYISYNDFKTSPFVTKKEKKLLLPFLLPIDHPAKPALDHILSSQRATLNPDTFAAAGFITIYSQPRSFIKVASHPLMPGYLVKVYLDCENRIKDDTPGWEWFGNRIKGANKIRKYIEKKKIKHFVVAKKWIYPLPLNPSIPNDPAYQRKNEILVVEDMNLVSEGENLHAWKNYITKEHLKELFKILSNAGGDSYRADNIVYTRQGKFAFIDTEYPHKKPRYRCITKYLSPEMAAYWKKLIAKKEALN